MTDNSLLYIYCICSSLFSIPIMFHLQWVRNGDVIKQEDPGINITTLKIDQPEPKFNGQYSCEVIHSNTVILNISAGSLLVFGRFSFFRAMTRNFGCDK